VIALPEVERAVKEAHDRLCRGDRHVVVIGPPAAGKTSVLSRLGPELDGKRLVRVTAPTSDADAGGHRREQG
jgi:predicted ATPase with chaperone activity